MSTKVGVISDTHGLLRPEAVAVLAGCDRIVHAGDIGKAEILSKLRDIAPLTAIRGNIDKWATDMADTEVLEVEGRLLYVLHDLKTLDLNPAAAGFDAVISGHSHKPDIGETKGVLYLNPGSAGPRRFKLPVALALLDVSPSNINAEIVELDV